MASRFETLYQSEQFEEVTIPTSTLQPKTQVGSDWLFQFHEKEKRKNYSLLHLQEVLDLVTEVEHIIEEEVKHDYPLIIIVTSSLLLFVILAFSAFWWYWKKVSQKIENSEPLDDVENGIEASKAEVSKCLSIPEFECECEKCSDMSYTSEDSNISDETTTDQECEEQEEDTISENSVIIEQEIVNFQAKPVEKIEKDIVPTAEDCEDANAADETTADENSEEVEKEGIAIQIETVNFLAEPVEKVQKETVPAAEDSEDANTSDETNANHNSEEPEKDSIAIQIETANPIITEEKETIPTGDDSEDTNASDENSEEAEENSIAIQIETANPVNTEENKTIPTVATTTKKTMKCNFCDKMFHDENGRKNHVLRVHKNQLLKISVENNMESTLEITIGNTLESHMSQNTQDSGFEPTSASEQSFLRTTIINPGDSQNFKGKSTRKRSGKNKKGIAPTIPCQECDGLFSTPKGLESHKQLKH